MRAACAFWLERSRSGRAFLSACLTLAALFAEVCTARADDTAPPPPQSAAVSTAELLQQMQQQMQQLRREVEQLRQMRPQPGVLPPTGRQRNTLLPAAAMQNAGQLPPADGAADNQGGGASDDTADPAAGLPAGEGPSVPGSGDNFPLTASYRYNAGGGYFHLGSADDTYTLNVQNLIALDGTFYDKASVNTPEKGFNMPFSRNYFFGNITKDWDYQIAFQESLGSFNVLDMWLNYRWCGDKLNVRIGRMLTPFLYEYYIFWPGFGPVITDSPLFNIAGRRREGVMAWGRLFDNKVQYQQGVFNSLAGGFFNLDRFVTYMGSLDFTPWKGSKGIFDSLGGGFSVQTGLQSYSLGAGTTDNFVNGAGEPTTNNVYVNSSGVPFFQYVPAMIANGAQNRVAPHLYWYNQFSVLAEYAYSERHLANTATGVQGLEQVNGFFVTLSYFLTGEKYSGDGLSGFGAIAPNRPFIPSQHQYGPGAWELGFQYSQLKLNRGVVADGFADPLINATQLNQLMTGVNWYMNKYTRFSFDWVNDQTNKPVPLGSNGHLSSQYNIYWTRITMYF